MNIGTIKQIGKLAVEYMIPGIAHPNYGRVIVTSNCNLVCEMCTFPGKKHIDPSLELVKHWIKEMHDFGIKEIDIGGGEPFLRKDLTEIAQYINDLGMISGMTTNGWFVGSLPFPPVQRCVVSVDGAKAATHDKIRGKKGSWERAINAVKTAQKHTTVTQINFVVQHGNYTELVDLCNFAKKEFGVPVAFIPISTKLAAQTPISGLLKEFNLSELRRVLEEAIATGNLLYNKGFIETFMKKLEFGTQKEKCQVPNRCVLVFSNGDVYPCGNLDMFVGNLTMDKKLSDIFDSYKGLRKDILSGKHQFCNNCIYPDIVNRKTIGTQIKELSKHVL